jgi:hypothetical protein
MTVSDENKTKFQEDQELIRSLRTRVEAWEHVATAMVREYPLYEEMDPLRKMLGLPLYTSPEGFVAAHAPPHPIRRRRMSETPEEMKVWLEAVRLVTGRSANGWHDLPQEDYEAGDVAVEHIAAALQELEQSRDESQGDLGREHGLYLNAQAEIASLRQRQEETEDERDSLAKDILESWAPREERARATIESLRTQLLQAEQERDGWRLRAEDAEPRVARHATAAMMYGEPESLHRQLQQAEQERDYYKAVHDDMLPTRRHDATAGRARIEQLAPNPKEGK